MGSTPSQPGQPGQPADQQAGQQPEPLFEHGRMITFKKRHVDPPSLYYFGPDDKLGIAWMSTLAAAQLAVGGRMLSPDGRIVPFSFLFQNTTPGKWMFPSEPLGEGFLLSVVANSQGAIVQRSQMFVDLFYVGHGSGLLAQGYVDDAHSVGWPPGTDEDPLSGVGGIARAFPANPAPGADLIYTVPNNLAQRLRSAAFTLVTSATAASRYMVVEFVDSGGTQIAQSGAAVTQNATNTFFYSFSLNLLALAVTGSGGFISNPLADVLLKHGDQIILHIAQAQAADQISAAGLTLDSWIIDEST